MNYNLFGNSSLRISELCLGTMNFGEEWAFGIDRKTSQAVFDTFADAGGNYIDTADIYTEGTSERWVGDFINTNREYFILSTKYSCHNRPDDPNAFGGSLKHMRRSVESSLQRLNTDYIDILWFHSWDFITGADELMRSLSQLVSEGKVLYLGLSNAPSWLLAQANTLAQQHGWPRFAAVQLEYSLAQRSIEPEFFTLMDAFDLNLSAWSPLGGGILTGKYQSKAGADKARFTHLGMDVSQAHQPLLAEVTRVAAELGCSLPQLALAWIRRRNPRIVPIVGASDVGQLQDNLGSLAIELDDAQYSALEAASRPVLHEPYGIMHRPDQVERIFKGYNTQIDNPRFELPR